MTSSRMAWKPPLTPQHLDILGLFWHRSALHIWKFPTRTPLRLLSQSGCLRACLPACLCAFSSSSSCLSCSSCSSRSSRSSCSYRSSCFCVSACYSWYYSSFLLRLRLLLLVLLLLLVAVVGVGVRGGGGGGGGDWWRLCLCRCPCCRCCFFLLLLFLFLLICCTDFVVLVGLAYHNLPVVPHKAVAEVSTIGNL